MKNEHHPADAADCPRASDAVALALNPANRPDAAAAAHLASCPVCAAAADAARATAARLRAAPEAEPAPDLTRRILDALPPARRRRFTLLRPLAAAAAAALLASALWFAARRTAPAAPTASGRWLVRMQQADGLWRPAIARAPADTAYIPALTALAALALERQGEPTHRPAVNRAIGALLAAQDPDGAFGPSGAARAYNHGMATAALLAIRQIRPSAVPDAPLRRAVARIRSTQDAAGAWGYTGDGTPNTALTVWQTDALIRARALGWGDAGGHLRKAVRWIKSQQTGDGRFAYDQTPGSPTATLDAMGYAILLDASLSAEERRSIARQAGRALQASAAADRPADFYRDYFIARALDAIGDRARAETLRSRVASLQAADGAWDTADRWTPVGGELYATALALLTLR